MKTLPEYQIDETLLRQGSNQLAMSLNGAESDSNSTASGSGTSNDVYEVEDPTFQIEEGDTTFEAAIGKLDELKLEPDTNVPEMDELETETGSVGDESMGSQTSEGDKQDEAKAKGVKITSDKGDGDGKKPSKISKKSSVFDRLKKLTRFDKSPKTQLKSNFSKFRGVKVDRLPACFVAKYLGKKDVKGLFGLQHVRKPVDSLIAKVKEDLLEMDKVELPLCYMVFSSKGIDIRPHKGNKVSHGIEHCLYPIDFISYGVQDMKYWRVFTFIVVNELSSRQKKMECHAFLADSTQSARKMALALGGCFQVYKKKLNAQGKFHNFQVELRPPDELANDLENDCDV